MTHGTRGISTDHFAVTGQILAGPDTGEVVGECRSPQQWEADTILVTRDLGSSSYAMLTSSRAVVCTSGGLAGHVPALCRAKGITVIRVADADLDRVTGTVRIDRDAAEIRPVASRSPAGSSSGVRPARSGPPGSACAVIAGSDDVDVVNRSRWAGRVDQFFLREEFLCLECGLSPLDQLARGGPGREHYAAVLTAALEKILAKLQPHQSVVFRLLDLRSDDAAGISRSVQVNAEPNPALGLHGTRWIIATPAYRQVIAAVVQRLAGARSDLREKLKLAAPFVADGPEFAELRAALNLPAGYPVSAFVETPGGVHALAAICAAGADQVFVGTKDLVQLVLAADRNNHHVAGSYDTRHPAVLHALARAVFTARDAGVPVRVFSFARDLDHYLDRLPRPNGYLMDAAELLAALDSQES